MKILVVGGGGREHAIVWRLAQDSSRPTLFCAPGNAGTAALAQNLPISAEDLPALLAWAKEHRPDLTVVGPEGPLCLGITDTFNAAGLRVFGPCQSAARMEGSKLFSKEVMNAAGVPTARSQSFDDAAAAVTALGRFSLPVVIKADGLAAGKGVIIAQTRDEAVAAVRSMLVDAVFGKAGAQVLIEEFLEGEEASILALV
ncbi:MAG TPA: phosphoribosylamine--glycine ligase, partial [Kiritimatiellia bacterium]|nr:phosphoribosylamine--glycine ligase [Kiritimatiellia bacterium]